MTGSSNKKKIYWNHRSGSDYQQNHHSQQGNQGNQWRTVGEWWSCKTCGYLNHPKKKNCGVWCPSHPTNVSSSAAEPPRGQQQRQQQRGGGQKSNNGAPHGAAAAATHIRRWDRCGRQSGSQQQCQAADVQAAYVTEDILIAALSSDPRVDPELTEAILKQMSDQSDAPVVERDFYREQQSLRARISNCNKQLSDMNNKCVDLQNELDSLRSKFDDCQTKRDGLQIDLDNLEADQLPAKPPKVVEEKVNALGRWLLKLQALAQNGFEQIDKPAFYELINTIPITREEMEQHAVITESSVFSFVQPRHERDRDEAMGPPVVDRPVPAAPRQLSRTPRRALSNDQVSRRERGRSRSAPPQDLR